MGYRLEFKNPNHPEEFIYAEALSLDVVQCLWY